MLEEYRDQERKKVSRVRSVMDYIMGGLLIFIGICFLLYEQLNLKQIFRRPHSSLDYVIAVLFVAYGAWRIYRGYKKHYYR